MAVVEIHPESIRGPWIDGFVLDRHVISSAPLGYVGEHMQFDTTRSPLGELVYQLKYKDGRPDDIVETATAFAEEHWRGSVDCVVSPPPSLHRVKQPAVLIADGIASRLRVTHKAAAVVKTRATPQMKNVTTYERAPLLGEAIEPGVDSVDGQRVLIVDDLWETGSTMKTVAEILQTIGALEIRALAITRTK